jgi:putative superfamily III holin-X
MAVETETQRRGEPETSDELLGELAHQFAVLIRCDLELTAAERAPELRQFAVDVGAVAAAASAALLAFATLSAAAVLGLAHAVSAWVAALIVGGAWCLVTVLMLRLGHVDRLRKRLASGGHEDAVAAARVARKEAEDAIKVAAARLAHVMVRQTAAHEVEAVVAAEKRIADHVERDVEAILRELVGALSIPEKAGGFMGRLKGRGGS